MGERKPKRVNQREHYRARLAEQTAEMTEAHSINFVKRNETNHEDMLANFSLTLKNWMWLRCSRVVQSHRFWRRRPHLSENVFMQCLDVTTLCKCMHTHKKCLCFSASKRKNVFKQNYICDSCFRLRKHKSLSLLIRFIHSFFTFLSFRSRLLYKHILQGRFCKDYSTFSHHFHLLAEMTQDQRETCTTLLPTKRLAERWHYHHACEKHLREERTPNWTNPAFSQPAL